MDYIRKTKIICTLGPATDEGDVLRNLIKEGMNVARFNFSHGTHDETKARLDKLKELREEMNLPIAAMLDTKGPEIRIKTFKDGKVTLKDGQQFTLTTGDEPGDKSRVAITFDDLYQDVSVGSRILIDDGLIEMSVVQIDGSDIVCKVDNGGTISDRKGVNVPNVELSLPYVSRKDYDDIIFGIEQGFDFIAASFTRTADDIREIKNILEENGGEKIRVIAKIENRQGVNNIDEILRISDGVMVARGDLGVEIPFEDVPVVQKLLISKAYNTGKQAVTATQMLDSMIERPRPTRAEAADVANAIYDGTSAVMLSGETAAGKYPVEAVKTMVKIAVETEQNIDYAERMRQREVMSNPDITNAIAHATCTTADDLNASAIITVTNSGLTCYMVSKFRPTSPIIGCSVYPETCRLLSLAWGVIPVLVDMKDNSDELFDHAVERAKEAGLVKDGQIVVITAGVPLGISGTTNMIKVHVAGNILVSGKGVDDRKASGNVCVANTAEELRERFKAGDIIVMEDTSNEMMPQIRMASGLILEADGDNSHGAIAGLSLNIPVITDAEHATEILKTGSYVQMDAKTGLVSTK
ncbi:MAG: pyruvate kinase [Lachnospiraceae bacterium]|nr:pyruvate kinase [Lachnospiraceae bacterium]